MSAADFPTPPTGHTRSTPTVEASRPERAEIRRSAAGIGLYAAAFGATFGAVAVAGGLTVAQAMVLSAVMFTGASQFAFVGVVGAGGAAFAGVPAALLLGLRNAFYGIPITAIIRPRGARRWLTAHFVIDETTGMAVARPRPAARRYAFWTTGLVLFVLWNAGTLTGAVLGTGVDPVALGLDAAAPAVFLALLWPQLQRRRAPVTALAGAGVAIALIPLAPAGVPVIAAAVVSIAGGFTGRAHGGDGDPGATP